MRFFIDNALPPRLAELRVAASHDAVHVRAYHMHDAADVAIVDRAREEDRIIVAATVVSVRFSPRKQRRVLHSS